jgi:metal-sulfur cluster biosynthetic enzyme
VAEPAAIIAALKTVHDPCCRDRDISVVDMGLIRSVEIEGVRARVELLLTSGWCPFASRILSSVREEIESLPGIDEASVDIVWDEAWTMARLSDDARAKLVFLPEPAAIGDRAAYVENASPSAEDSSRPTEVAP